jgi:tetratricopeptide (TPR) repeat protein
MPGLRLFILIFFSYSAAASQPLAGDRSPHRTFESALTAFNKGDYKQALDMLNMVIAQDPHHQEAYLTRAIIKEQENDQLGAITDYSALLHMNPDHPEALFGRGALRYHLGHYAQAIADFEHFLSLGVRETVAVYFKQSAGDEGVTGIATTSTISADAYNFIGLCHAALGQPYKAVQAYNDALAGGEGQANIYINLGEAYESLDSLHQARAAYRQALAHNPANAMARYKLAATDEKDRKSGPQRLEEYSRLIEENPSFEPAYYQRALLYIESGQPERALRDFTAALQLDDSDYRVWYNRAHTKAQLDDAAGAIADYTRAISLNRDFAKSYAGRAGAFVKIEEYEAAIPDYEMAIALQPDNGMYLYNLAATYLNLKDRQRACHYLSLSHAQGFDAAANLMQRKCKSAK